MAAVRKVRGRRWEDRETKLLLEKWGDENIQLRLRSCTRKKPIWLEMGDFLRACGYEDRDGEACKVRLHTLVTAYRQYKDECNKTGNGTPSKKPPFFDELDEVLSDKPSTLPKCVINSTKIVAASFCGVGEENLNGAKDQYEEDENIDLNIPSSSTGSSSAAKCTEGPVCVTGKPCNIYQNISLSQIFLSPLFTKMTVKSRNG